MTTTTKAIINTEKQGNTSVEEVYDSFFCPNGEVNEPALKRLITAHLQLQENASKVYTEVTNGLLSNWSESPQNVIAVHNQIQQTKVDKETTCEDMLNMFGKDNEFNRQLIMEYFENK